MGELMDRAVIGMPFEMAMENELSRRQFYARAQALLNEVQACRLLLKECNEVIAEDGGVYIELRAYLSGELPASEIIALLGEDSRHG